MPGTEKLLASERTTRLPGSTLDLFYLRSQTDEDREEEKPRAPYQRAIASRFLTYEPPLHSL